MQYLHPAQAGECLLGSARYGQLTPVAEGICVPLPCLAGPAGCWTSWLAPAPLEHGRLGEMVFHHNAELLFGRIQLRETDFSGELPSSALQAASRAAYTAVFDTLRQTGFAHLVRCWNYLPDINADEGGLERYRQFNIGRQEAFATCHPAPLESAPAASALGTRGGDLSVYFLASHTPAIPLENPRQVPAYHYPSQYGPRSPIFSRGALLPLAHGESLFISGTASILGHASVHPGDVGEQTHETLRNIAAVVCAANEKAAQAFRCEELKLKVFVRNPIDLPLIREIIAGHWGNAGNALFVQADVCRAELLVEIEAFCSHRGNHT